MPRTLGFAAAATILTLLAVGSASAQQSHPHPGGVNAAMADGSVRSARSGASSGENVASPALFPRAGALKQMPLSPPRLRLRSSTQLEKYDYPGEYAQRFDGVAPGASTQTPNVGANRAISVGAAQREALEPAFQGGVRLSPQR